MHLLLPICGKFTRAQIAHQIFMFQLTKHVYIKFQLSSLFEIGQIFEILPGKN
jgi:hypothetical protein